MAKQLTREERETIADGEWKNVTAPIIERFEITLRASESRVEELEEFVRNMDCDCDGAPDGRGRCGRCLILGEDA